jgi:8-oxo-dGTP pyrophosphatase MutT (NUDIX family)
MAKKPRNAPKRSSGAAKASPGRPPSLQIGALCYRRTGSGHRILLITSRDTGRWVIPKGWPMRNRTEPEAAAREAFEEAGLRGAIGEKALGLYSYLKLLPNGRAQPCVVRVFPFEVLEMVAEFPEREERRSKWFRPGKAAKKVQEPELSRLIREFAPEDAREDQFPKNGVS